MTGLRARACKRSGSYDSFTMNRPKCILVNGFAGSGKSTVARMYADEHPMALIIEGDELVVNIGHWLDNEEQARHHVDELIGAMLGAHLSAGADVVLPYLVEKPESAAMFQQIAEECGAVFVEIVLLDEREIAIGRLMARGTWGERGVPPVTQTDGPAIDALYDLMIAALNQRPDSIVVRPEMGSPDRTYREVLAAAQLP